MNLRAWLRRKSLTPAEAGRLCLWYQILKETGWMGEADEELRDRLVWLTVR
jgi:hypothetical protein